MKSPPGKKRLYDAFDLIPHKPFKLFLDFCILPNKILKGYFPVLVLIHLIKLCLPVQFLILSDPVTNLIDILFFEESLLLNRFLWIYIIVMEKL